MLFKTHEQCRIRSTTRETQRVVPHPAVQMHGSPPHPHTPHPTHHHHHSTPTEGVQEGSCPNTTGKRSTTEMRQTRDTLFPCERTQTAAPLLHTPTSAACAGVIRTLRARWQYHRSVWHAQLTCHLRGSGHHEQLSATACVGPSSQPIFRCTLLEAPSPCGGDD